MAEKAQASHSELISELSQLADGRKKLSELKAEYPAGMAEKLAKNPGLPPRPNTISGEPEVTGDEWSGIGTANVDRKFGI